MNVFISYDFLTTQSHVGKRGLERFDFIFDILKKLGINVRLDTNLSHNFPIKKFYALHHKIYKDYTLNYIEPDSNCAESRALVDDYLAGCDIFIGYELSEQTRIYLEKIDVCHIDIWLSPLRFCKDLLFSFYSNVGAIQKQLRKYQTPDDYFWSEANQLTNYCREFHPLQVSIEEGSALIVGQLSVDKACQKGDNFLSLIDYQEELIQISRSHSYLYLLKHPLMPVSEFQSVVNGLSDITNLVFLKEQNVYELLSDARIKSVVALSSSVLKEAKFFNKEVFYLFRPVLDQRYKDVHQAFFSAIFWKEILNIDGNNENWTFYHCDNYIRKKFNAFYAYEKFVSNLFNPTGLERLESAYDVVVSVGHTLENLPNEKSYVMYGLGTVGRLIFPQLRNRLKGIIDRTYTEQNLTEYNGVPIIDLKDLKQNDKVLIASFAYNHEIMVALNLLALDVEIIPLYQ